MEKSFLQMLVVTESTIGSQKLLLQLFIMQNNDVISHATSSLTYSTEGLIYNENNHEVIF
jgi:hypothetical protein